MSLLFTVIAAPLLAAIVVPLALIFVFKYIEAGFAIAGLLMALEMLTRGSLSINLAINLYPEDFGYALIALAAALRIAFVRPMTGISWIWGAFGGVLLLSFSSGFGTYGSAAGVQFREYFYAWTAAFYAMTFRVDSKAIYRIFLGLVWLAVWIEVCACLQWLAVFSGSSFLVNYADTSDPGALRVIKSAEALILANAVIFTLFYQQSSGLLNYLRSLNLIWIPSLIVLQHRSVWLAALAGAAKAFRIRRTGRVHVKPVHVLLVATAIAAMFVVALVAGRGAATIASTVGESARRGVALEDTASWRLKGWREMFEKWRGGGPTVLAIGFPFGSDRMRFIETNNFATQGTSVQAHNAYVQTLYNCGIIGVGLFLSFIANLSLKLKSLVDRGICRSSCNALAAITVCQGVYYIFYGIEPLQIFFLGVSHAYVIGATSALTVSSKPSLRQEQNNGYYL